MSYDIKLLDPIKVIELNITYNYSKHFKWLEELGEKVSSIEMNITKIK